MFGGVDSEPYLVSRASGCEWLVRSRRMEGRWDKGHKSRGKRHKRGYYGAVSGV